MGKLTNLNPIADSDLPSTITRDSELTAAMNAHVAAADPHIQYLLTSEGDARYRLSATALTDSELPSTITRDSELTATMNAHVAAPDPHSQYLLTSEGDARYRQFNTQTFTATIKSVGTSTGTIANTDPPTQANKCGSEIQAANSTSAAYISFHRPGIYGAHFGLDTNNQLCFGGWSLGNASYKIFHEGSVNFIRTPLPTAAIGVNSVVMGWNSMEPGLGIAEICNYAGAGGGDAINFFRVPGAENSISIFHRVARIDKNGAYVQMSDGRVKRDFAEAPGLSAILALKPKKYRHWECTGYDYSEKKLKLGGNFTDKIGFIAQEVEQILPEAVIAPNRPEELYGLDYNVLIPCLVRAIQELTEKVTALEARLPASSKT